MSKTPVRATPLAWAMSRRAALVLLALASLAFLPGPSPLRAALVTTPAAGAAKGAASDPRPAEADHAAPVGAGPSIDLGGEGPPAGGPDLGLVPEGAQPVDALPLSRFVGADAKASAAGGPRGFWEIFSRVRDGGLPEPASWALMLIGFGMIGGALRGFIVANRRLARLQPEDPEGPTEE